MGFMKFRCIELEDILDLPSEEAPTLSLLDSTLRRFLALCATYHGTLNLSNQLVLFVTFDDRTILAEPATVRPCL